MLLDELPWQEPNSDLNDGVANITLPSGLWLYVVRYDNYTKYDIYCDEYAPPNTGKTLRHWWELDTLTAQCVLYELFGVTPTGNEHGEEDGDTGKTT